MTTNLPWHKKYPDRAKASRKKYYEANKKKVQAKHRKHYADNKDYYANYYRKNKELYRAYKRKGKLKREYGLTLEQFNAMLLKQGGWCAICHSNIKDQPNVDHCHNTGRVRGLLCKSCNFMLGLASDSPAILRAAAKYLTKKR